MLTTIRGGDKKVGKVAIVLFVPLRALGVRLLGLFSLQISEFLVQLLDFFLGIQVLKDTANSYIGKSHGDGVHSGVINVGLGLENIKGTLGRVGIGVVDNVGGGWDFTFFDVRGDGEMR